MMAATMAGSMNDEDDDELNDELNIVDCWRGGGFQFSSSCRFFSTLISRVFRIIHRALFGEGIGRKKGRRGGHEAKMYEVMQSWTQDISRW